VCVYIYIYVCVQWLTEVVINMTRSVALSWKGFYISSVNID